MASALSGFRLTIALPDGWDGRVFQRPSPDGSPTFPVLQAGNFSIPTDAGDFGNGAYTEMGPTGLFLSLVEYDPNARRDPLFSNGQQFPIPVLPDCFDPFALPRWVSGMAGRQFFFTYAARAFCLFCVIGSYDNRMVLAPILDAVVATLTIT